MAEFTIGGTATMIGDSQLMANVYEAIRRVAETDATVLIRGESGTGKELVASAIHYNSTRREAPFVTVNCAALARDLMESEMFGHEKGSFTGAVQRREGKFEAAEGGTLLLDEIGDMHLDMQAKLLRALQEEKRFERIGSNRSMAANVRIITATNQDLEAMLVKGSFRHDLYYRIKVVEIYVPPLRQRSEDIPALIRHFLHRACHRFNTTNDGGILHKQLTKEALQACLKYPWPGNVRQLRATIEQAVILSESTEITPEMLFLDYLTPPTAFVPVHRQQVKLNAQAEWQITAGPAAEAPARSGPPLPQPPDYTLQTATDMAARAALLRALEATGGNAQAAAGLLGVSRYTVYRMMARLQIEAVFSFPMRRRRHYHHPRNVASAAAASDVPESQDGSGT